MTSMTSCDLKPHLEAPVVRELLFALVGWRGDEARDREALERALASYRYDSSLSLFGLRREETLAGLIGLDAAVADERVIRHLVVHPTQRGRGVGRALLGAALDMHPAKLVAETDLSAVEFYRRCGFEVMSLGERYPGTERFYCVLEPIEKRVL